MLGRLNILMGGRCAEKLVFNDTTTGAGNDIEVATNIARKMVCDWGMSDKIGPLKFGKKDEEVLLQYDEEDIDNTLRACCTMSLRKSRGILSAVISIIILFIIIAIIVLFRDKIF